MSGKGGVGKSTLAYCLALALRGGHVGGDGVARADQPTAEVAMLDLDLCGPSLPRLAQLSDAKVTSTPSGWVPPRSPDHGIPIMSSQFLLPTPDTPLPWRGPRKSHLIRRFIGETYWSRQDFLLIDTPPGTSDEHLAVLGVLSAAAAPHGALIVTTPSAVALAVVTRQLTFCRKMSIPIIGIVENMGAHVCPCCQNVTNLFGPSAGEEQEMDEYVAKGGGSVREAAHAHGIPFLGAIPQDPQVAADLDKGQCPMCTHPESPAVPAIERLARRVREEVERVAEKK
jgi:Mrp family chromosome partitioning ATPase